jgi:hypothetical protein
VVSVTPRSRFTPGERTPVPIGQEAWWAPEPVWAQRLQEKIYFCHRRESNLDRPVVQSAARHYTDRVTPVHQGNIKRRKGFFSTYLTTMERDTNKNYTATHFIIFSKFLLLHLYYVQAFSSRGQAPRRHIILPSVEGHRRSLAGKIFTVPTTYKHVSPLQKFRTC